MHGQTQIKSLLKFRSNLSVPPSRIQKGTIGCPETSVRNYHNSLHNNPEERRSHLLRNAITHVSGPLNDLINISHLGKLYDGDEVNEKLGESHSTLAGVTTCTEYVAKPADKRPRVRCGHRWKGAVENLTKNICD